MGKLYFKAQQFEKFSSIHVVEVMQTYGSDSWKMLLVLSWFQDISHYLKTCHKQEDTEQSEL